MPNSAPAWICVVAGAGFTQSDIFIPGLVYLLIHGNFTSDWTLYKTMKVAPPDSLCSWDETGFHSSIFFTVKPKDERWTSGWDELVAEMYELSRQAIVEVLKMSRGWILPLSGGLDSRLIAAVGAERGVTLHAYCWGRRESSEVACSQKIARALGIPWKWINIGTDYMVKYSQFWADMFGSSMHFHGIYQMPFYDALKSEPPGPIMSGSDKSPKRKICDIPLLPPVLSNAPIN